MTREQDIAYLISLLARSAVLLRDALKKIKDLKFDLEPEELLQVLKYKDRIEIRCNELMDGLSKLEESK